MALNLCVCWAYRTDIFVVLFLRFLLHLHRHSSRTYQCAIMSVLNVFLFSILNYCSIVFLLNACVCTFQFASTNITHECELIQFHIIIPYSYKWNLNTRFIDMFAVWWWLSCTSIYCRSECAHANWLTISIYSILNQSSSLPYDNNWRCHFFPIRAFKSN